MFSSDKLWNSIASLRSDIDKLETKITSGLDTNKKDHEITDLKLRNDSQDITNIKLEIKTLKLKLDTLENGLKDMMSAVMTEIEKINSNFEISERTLKSHNNRINTLESKASKIKDVL